MKVSWRGAILAVAGLACGCPVAPPPTDLRQVDGGDPGPGQMVLGGAALDGGGFIPLTDGQDRTLVYGAQGGFHVWMKFRLKGVAPQQGVTMQRQAFRVSDDQIVLRTMGSIDIGAPDGDGWFEAPLAFPMFMCPSPIGIKVIDEPIRYEIVLAYGGSALATGKIVLVPRCPTDVQKDLDFCIKICSG